MAFPNIMSSWRSAQRIDQIPTNISTGYSSVNNGNVSLDPSIRRFQDESYGRLGEGITRYLGDIDSLRGRFTGNESAFRQARVNPLLQQTALRRGDLQRSIGLRGLGGSSFGDQAMTNFDLDSQRSIGDATALAERENIDALGAIDKDRLSGVGMYSDAGMNLAKDRLAQELAALGIGQQQAQQILQSRIAQNAAYNQTLGTFHKLVTDWGDFAKMMPGGGLGGDKQETDDEASLGGSGKKKSSGGMGGGMGSLGGGGGGGFNFGSLFSMFGGGG